MEDSAKTAGTIPLAPPADEAEAQTDTTTTDPLAAVKPVRKRGRPPGAKNKKRTRKKTTKPTTPAADSSESSEESATPEVDLSGFYQLVLSDDAPCAEFPLPIIVKHDPKTDTNVTYIVCAEKYRSIRPLQCPNKDCAHKWEPEQLMRPGRVARAYADERKWKRRYHESFYCPRCRKEVPEKKPPRGQVIGAGKGRKIEGRRVRRTVYLTNEEVLRAARLVDPTRAFVPRMEEIKLEDGSKKKVQVGWASKPLTFDRPSRDTDEWEQVPMADFISLRPVDGEYVRGVTPKAIEAYRQRSQKVNELDIRIAELQGEFVDSMDALSSSELKAMREHMEDLRRQRNLLSSEITEP